MFVLGEIGFYIDHSMYGIFLSDENYDYCGSDPKYIAVISDSEDDAILVSAYNSDGSINRNDAVDQILSHIESVHKKPLDNRSKCHIILYARTLLASLVVNGN